MSKLDREFRDDVNQTMSESDYVGRKVVLRVIVVVLALVIICGVGGVVYTQTIGKVQKNAEREVFKSSVAYTEQATQFLAKSYKEYNDTDDNAEKDSITGYVAMKYPNLDIDSIDNSKLRSFYEKCIQ